MAILSPKNGAIGEGVGEVEADGDDDGVIDGDRDGDDDGVIDGDGLALDEAEALSYVMVNKAQVELDWS